MSTTRINIFVCLLFAYFAGLGTGHAAVREPVVAGMFYPADSSELASVVEEHLENVGKLPACDGQLIALIVPHAGLIYSGQIAAYSYKLLEGSNIDRIILCGPSHRFPFNGVSVYGPRVTWNTPLGAVDCHEDLCRRLLQSHKRIDFLQQAHASEHSLEVQLPYIQTVTQHGQIVPVVMGSPDAENVRLLGDALSSLDFDERTIMVASTDWQHYHPASQGWKMDSLGMECLKDLDFDRLEHLIRDGKVEACGAGPMLAVMRAAVAMGADRATVLKYGDSGDLTGDKSSVVGYLAAAIYRSADISGSDAKGQREDNSITEETPEYTLSNKDKQLLLRIARESIKGYLANGTAPEFEVSDNLDRPGAAFVTLKQNGRLRGCIGHTVAQKPLYETVSTCGIQAATADPRFYPVRIDELDGLKIEISVLTPLEQVRSLDEIEVGRDGLMIVMNSKRGLLLPQVATEYGWSRKDFLQNTCRKAGLPLDAYQSADATIFKYQAIVFGETEESGD